MDQIITLLSNLFNLTKIASVTLPGLALAGALALFLWPPRPIDAIRVPVVLPPPNSLPEAELPCAHLPPLEKGNLAADDQRLRNCKPTAQPQDTRAACILTSVYLNRLADQRNFADTIPQINTIPQSVKNLCQARADYEPIPTGLPDQNDTNDSNDNKLSEAVAAWCGNSLSIVRTALALKREHKENPYLISQAESALGVVCAPRPTLNPGLMKTLRANLKTLCIIRLWLPKWPFTEEENLVIVGLAKRDGLSIVDANKVTATDVQLAMVVLRDVATESQRLPWQASVVKQFVLDRTKDLLVQCNDLETALLGQEQADNDQLKTDIANLDKQRSDLQDAYIASLKTNDRVITENFRRKLSAILELSNEYRARSGINLVSINERSRRLDEIKHEQAKIDAILAEPGAIRALQGFDVYIQGLINHVVGFILLSIALSIILVAFDRTVLGNLYEDVFPGW